MKHLKYLPFAFLAGVHGFAILAPYLALCATVHAIAVQRRRRIAAGAVRVATIPPTVTA
jgi:hypothetical protein